MAEIPSDPKVLEEALRNALKTLFQAPPKTRASDPHEEFYAKYLTESDEYDEYFLKKYGGDLDNTLLFTTLFSAITASFILAIQTQLQPDYSQLNYAVLMFIANSTFQKSPNLGVSPDESIWTGPDSIIVHVQAVLFSSLAISLLAAFIATLSKQWLSRYSESRGSLTKRGRDRQRKIKGMSTWHFGLMIEGLPLLLQAALLLFSYALAIYLTTINKTIAAVAIGFTSFGLLFYFLIAAAATLSYNCPFQTPLSLFLRILSFYVFRPRYTGFLLKRMFLGGFRRFGGHQRMFLGRLRRFCRHQRMFLGRLRHFCRPHAPEEVRGDHIELDINGSFDRLPPLVSRPFSRDNYSLDAESIFWLSERSTGAEVTVAIAGLVPEIVWDTGIAETPLVRLNFTMREYFDFSSHPPVVIPELREKAYLTAKALLHLVVQRRGIEPERVLFRFILVDNPLIGSGHYDTDSDLESTLCMIYRVCKDENLPSMRWGQFSFTVPHQTWMGYILRCYASPALKNGDPLPVDVEQFVLHSLRPVPPPPAPIVQECLHIIGVVLGIRLRYTWRQAINERISSQIDSIYDKLENVWDTNSTEVEISRALQAMKLIVPLSMPDIATNSYRLFRAVMHTPVSTTHHSEKWEASRLALHGAYKGGDLPPIDDPQDVLTFLNYHFELALQDENQDEPILNALRALAYASDPATIKSFVHFDPAQSSFVRFAFKVDRPLELRKAALFLLPLIGDKWFDATHQIIPGEMDSFAIDWATAVDGIEHTGDVQRAILTALLHMMDSLDWRPHIPEGKWKLLEYYPSLPDDCPPLKRCLENQELVAAISQVTDPEAIALWPRILWLKYGELTATVQEALKEITRSAKGREHIDEYYLEAVESGLKEAEEERLKHDASPEDPVAAALDKKIRNHQQARDALEAIKNQVDVD